MEIPRPKVSVIVPVRNRAATLPRALRSILAQDYADFDITVVDGNSNDGSPDIALQFPNTRVLQQPGKGIADAYNHGIRVSTAPLVAFLSSDDEWTPHKLSTQVAALLAEAGAMYSLAYVRYRVEDGATPPPGFRMELLEGTHPGTMETLLARREVFEAVGFFDTQYITAEDMDWFARARDAKVGVAWVREPLLVKYVHGTNISLTERSNNASLLKLLAGSIARKRGQIG